MPRTRSVRVRASEEELEHWHALARAAGLPLSDLIRRSLGRVRPWSPGEAAAHAERTRQIARIGSNLNQVARRVNVAVLAGERVSVLAGLEAIAEDLAGLRMS